MPASLTDIRAGLLAVNTGAITLAATLLGAVEAARDLLAAHADGNEEIGTAFQILADAAAEAAPPPACGPLNHTTE